MVVKCYNGVCASIHIDLAIIDTKQRGGGDRGAIMEFKRPERTGA